MGHLIRAANAFAPQPWRSTLGPTTDYTARERAISNYVQFLSDTYVAHAPGARVVVDPNGGAACAVAERAFRALGVEPIVLNGVEGKVAHEVDVDHARPDGTHVLDDVATAVRDQKALFGLAYDFDADRGHLTYVDAAGVTHIPSPQTAAAVNTAIALAVHRRSGDRRRAAVVASDATSCRVKQVAASFGADFYEVETGEINVVTRMQDLERHDICAAVGVEGPNGGTVFAGTTCRDGTLVGAGALLAAADRDLRAIVCETLGRGRQMRSDLAGFIELLPPQRSFTEKHPAPVDWNARWTCWTASSRTSSCPHWRRAGSATTSSTRIPVRCPPNVPRPRVSDGRRGCSVRAVRASCGFAAPRPKRGSRDWSRMRRLKGRGVHSWVLAGACWSGAEQQLETISHCLTRRRARQTLLRSRMAAARTPGTPSRIDMGTSTLR